MKLSRMIFKYMGPFFLFQQSHAVEFSELPRPTEAPALIEASKLLQAIDEYKLGTSEDIITKPSERILESTARLTKLIFETEFGREILFTIKNFDLIKNASEMSDHEIAATIAKSVRFQKSAHFSDLGRAAFYLQSISVSIVKGQSPQLLVTQLAHEMYQIVDKINFLETSTNFSELYQIIPIEDFKFPEKQCISLLVLTSKKLRNALSAIRAQRIEKLILNQLGIEANGSEDTTSDFSFSTALILSDELQTRSAPVLTSKFVHESTETCLFQGGMQARVIYENNSSAWLKSKRMDGRMQSLFDYLTHPKVLDVKRVFNRSSGPRGSVGTGDP